MGFEDENYEVQFIINGKTFPVNVVTNVLGSEKGEDWEDDEDEEEQETVDVIQESANHMFETYQAFIKAGFDKNQAFALLKLIMKMGGKYDSEN